MGMLEGTATVATLILSGDSIHVDDTALGSSWSARRKRRGVYVKVFSKYSRVAKTYGGRGGKYIYTSQDSHKTRAPCHDGASHFWLSDSHTYRQSNRGLLRDRGFTILAVQAPVWRRLPRASAAPGSRSSSRESIAHAECRISHRILSLARSVSSIVSEATPRGLKNLKNT